MKAAGPKFIDAAIFIRQAIDTFAPVEWRGTDAQSLTFRLAVEALIVNSMMEGTHCPPWLCHSVLQLAHESRLIAKELGMDVPTFEERSVATYLGALSLVNDAIASGEAESTRSISLH